MSLFLITFVLAVLLGILTVYFVLKRKRYGHKTLYFTLTLFVLSLIIVIPLGNQPLTADYKNDASSFPYDRFLNGSVPEGTIVKVKGKVLSLDGFEVNQGNVFILESDDGSFYIKNKNVEEKEIKDGEIITVYGGYAGTGESDSPSINAQLIER